VSTQAAAALSIAVTTLITFGIIPASTRTALLGAVALLLLNALGWRLVSATFDRERLIIGTR
jgi:hypothetical protein